MNVQAVEERHEGAVIGRVGYEPIRDNDLVGGINGNLPVVALDEPVPGRQDATVWVGEVALRTIRRTTLFAPQCPALPAHARRGARSALILRVGRIGGFGFQRRLG